MLIHKSTKIYKRAKSAKKLGQEMPPLRRKDIVSLVQVNRNYAHFSYKEMEQEITGRVILCSAWNCLQEKAKHAIVTIKSRAIKLEKTTLCPLSLQQSFNSSLEHKEADFRNFADKFLFGGDICLIAYTISRILQQSNTIAKRKGTIE